MNVYTEPIIKSLKEAKELVIKEFDSRNYYDVETGYFESVIITIDEAISNIERYHKLHIEKHGSIT